MRNRAKLRLWCVLLAAVTVFIVWCFAAWVAARWLIIETADDVAGDRRGVEAIVVLAGSSAYLERTAHAARIWREHPSAHVILTNDGGRSGWLESEQRNPLFVERARWALEREGVPADRIEELPQVVSGTHSEAVLLHNLALRRDLHSLVIVTSSYHTRRARWILRRVFDGSSVVLDVRSPSHDQATPAPSTWWLHKSGWQSVAGEYVKFIYYGISY